MAKFKRPIAHNKNQILRQNLAAPPFEGFPLDHPESVHPAEGLVVKNRQPQKNPVNRGLITRRDDDKQQNIYIGLQDHDETIQYYFDNVIKPSVVTNAERINVPLVYGAPERWKGVQKDGYYRDKEGKIQTPLIMFKRDSVERRRDLGKKMDANNPQLQYVFQSKYTSRNQYDNFSILQNRTPQKEFFAVAVPDYVRLKYSFIIWTDYVAQMNKLVESINYASDSYWGDEDRFKFNARIDSFSNTVEVAQGTNRMVKTTFGLDLQGYIVPDAMNVQLNSHPGKFFSKSVVTMQENIEEINTQGTTSREEARKGAQIIGNKGSGISQVGIDGVTNPDSGASDGDGIGYDNVEGSNDNTVENTDN